MSWLDSFTVLIQLISAVNFVYIVSHFPSTVIDYVFDRKKLITDKFGSYTNQITADLQSLESMKPMIIQDGRSNQDTIDALKKDYEELKNKWVEKQDTAEKIIDKVKSVKGTKCLFLYISLYCIFSIFNIAMMKVTNADFWLVTTVLLNIFAFLYSSYYTFVICSHKWDEKDSVECYVSTCHGFAWSVVLAFVLSYVNSLIVKCLVAFPIYQIISNILLSLCVFLPFYPFLMVIGFILWHERRVKCLTGGNETKELEGQQIELHKRKDDLDNVEKMFTLPKFR